MSLDRITNQCFIVLAETGSFTKTAEKVGRTQSAVSQQIAKLERMLDKPLIKRGKTISLTHDGEVFLDYARKIFTLQSDAIDRFHDPDLQGEVRFGLPEDFASVFLNDVLVEYTSIHPRVKLNIECDLTLILYDHFKRNLLDLVLVKMSKPDEFPASSEVWSEELVWVSHPDYRLNDKVTNLVLSPRPCVYRNHAIEALKEHDIPWRLVLSTHSYSSIIAAVNAKLGITVLPKNMIPKGFKIVQNNQLPRLSDVHISLIKRNYDNGAVDTLQAFIMERLCIR